MGSDAPSEESPERTNAGQFSSVFYEKRVAFFTLLAVLPSVLVSGVLLALWPWPLFLKVVLILLVVSISALLGRLLRKQIVYPLHTLSNVIAALREEDFSFRARGATPNDPLGQLALEINTLAELLAAQNTRTIEATTLLRRVMESVDVPMFAFDPGRTLRLVNSAGERMLRKPTTALLGRNAGELSLGSLLAVDGETQIVLPQTAERRWFVRRSEFRQNGLPHTLLVLADVSRVLREEERMAWQRIIRVLGHELNNSLAPIKSIAGTLAARVSGLPVEVEQQQDFQRGLNIIESRAASLNRFLQAYRRLAQMPRPSAVLISVGPLMERVAALESRLEVELEAGPELEVSLDVDQIEQMLINLIKNAAEAALDAHGDHPANAQVVAAWSVRNGQLEITIEDNGAGLSNPDNAFVPFYTTKPEGSGIGLVLSRQIAEAHGGSMRLGNRQNDAGCVATVTLPLYSQSSAIGHQLAKTNSLRRPSASNQVFEDENRGISHA